MRKGGRGVGGKGEGWEREGGRNLVGGKDGMGVDIYEGEKE